MHVSSLHMGHVMMVSTIIFEFLKITNNMEYLYRLWIF